MTMTEAVFKSLFVATFVTAVTALLGYREYIIPTFIGYFLGSLAYEVYRLRKRNKLKGANDNFSRKN